MIKLGPSNVLNLVRKRVTSAISVYEELIGIKQVKEAQDRVLNAEVRFKSSQEERRLSQELLTSVQSQLRSLRQDIDRTPRGDVRYLELIKREIDITKEERDIRNRFEHLEQTERELFSELSNALRTSHEKERAQGEKTKYWSILGSLIGAGLGILGTTVNTRLRHNQTKDILMQTSSHVKQIEDSVQSLVARFGMTVVEMKGGLDLEGSKPESLGSLKVLEKYQKNIDVAVGGLNSAIERLQDIAHTQGIMINQLQNSAGYPKVGNLEGEMTKEEAEALFSSMIGIMLVCLYFVTRFT